MKVQETEPTMSAILCYYTKIKGRKLLQDDPHLLMEIYSADKSYDNIGWDDIMWGQITRHCNQ